MGVRLVILGPLVPNAYAIENRWVKFSIFAAALVLFLALFFAFNIGHLAGAAEVK